MAKDRNVSDVIDAVIEVVPLDLWQFRKDLQRIKEDAAYTAPEAVIILWRNFARVLTRYIPKPVTAWQFKVISIFTTKSIPELKKEYKK